MATSFGTPVPGHCTPHTLFNHTVTHWVHNDALQRRIHRCARALSGLPGLGGTFPTHALPDYSMLDITRATCTHTHPAPQHSGTVAQKVALPHCLHCTPATPPLHNLPPPTTPAHARFYTPHTGFHYAFFTHTHTPYTFCCLTPDFPHTTFHTLHTLPRAPHHASHTTLPPHCRYLLGVGLAA